MTNKPGKPVDSSLAETGTTDSDRAQWIAEFSAELRRMHEQAGKPSLRQMAIKVPYSHTALSHALRGVGGRLPSLELTMALVRACGSDEQAWRDRWHHEHARIAAPATSRDPDLGATDAVPSDVDVQPPPRWSRRPLLLCAVGVSVALVIGGVVLAVNHGVGSAPPTDGIGGALPACETSGPQAPSGIVALANQIPKKWPSRRIKECIARFSTDLPRQPGPWPFFVYDTTITPNDLGVIPGLTPAEVGNDDGVGVRTTPGPTAGHFRRVLTGTIIWADCYVNSYQPPAPLDDNVGPKWLRIHWSTNTPGQDTGYSSPTDPFVAYVYAGYTLPFAHNGQIPSCASP